MDIWRWIHDAHAELRLAGRHRLAELIEVFSHAVSEGRHAQVDAMKPEAVALAREAKSPWLEVFFRHWYLQSKVFHRCEVDDALPEAVSLLELTASDDARDCPQSVCVTQDLAQCYAQLDGPGYVDERIAVASETLSRIDAGWPCFRCISDEYAGALCDARRFDDVLAFVAAQRRAMLSGGADDPGGSLNSSAARALLALGRADEALGEAERWDVSLAGKTTEMTRDLLRALALLRLGRVDEAAPLIPSAEAVLEIEDNYAAWARCVRDLASRGVDVPGTTGRALWTMHRRMEGHGALYGAATVARIAAEIALSRGALRAAQLGVDAARALVPRLRAPDYLVARTDGVEARIKAEYERRQEQTAGEGAGDGEGAGEGAGEGGDGGGAWWRVPDDATAESVMESLGADAERELDVLSAARARWPDDEDLACMEARALDAAGHPALAERALRGFLAEHPDAHDAVETLAETLLRADAHADLAELLAQLGDPPPPMALRYRVRSAHRRGDRDACAEALEALLDVMPGDRGAVALLARVERERGNWARALALLDQLIEVGEPGEFDWDRMVAAAVVGDWARVRGSARRLGIDVDDGDEPIDEAWEPCMVRLFGEREDATVLAQRTGPVTARVFQMAGPGKPEHFRDVVVFDPAPLNPPTARDDDDDAADPGSRPLLVFPAVHVLERGQMICYSLDGVHPGDDRVDAIRAGVEAQGGVLSVRSGDAYRVVLPTPGEVVDFAGSSDSDSDSDSDSGSIDSDSEVLGVYAFIAVPVDTSAAALHAALSRLTRDLPHPLVWLELAEALGDDAELTRQRAIAAAYGL